MQFVIIAKDYTDDDALARRLAARPEHFKRIDVLKNQGHFLLGGAILDDQKRMVGSVLVADFESRQDLEDRWLKHEPYITERVWEHVQVLPFNTAMLGEKMIEKLMLSLAG